MTYLDYHASAPLRPVAREAMRVAMDDVGNPSSVHAYGRRVRAMIEDARAHVAALVGAKPHEVIFTSHGTEANHTALLGLGARRAIVSAIEHSACLRVWPDPAILPCDAHGVVQPDTLAAIADLGAGDVVSVMLANNETGVIQPVAALAAYAKAKGAWMHTDAVQACGKMPCTMDELGVDLMSVSAHKIGGPQGVGALIAREGIALTPYFRGGGQEMRRRAGTENVYGIVGFGAAARATMEEQNTHPARLAAWRDAFEDALLRHKPRAVIFGRAVPRLPTVTAFAEPDVLSTTRMMQLDLAGIAISAGAACSSGKIQTSHVLRAMGVPEALAACALRASTGWGTEERDYHVLLHALTK